MPDPISFSVNPTDSLDFLANIPLQYPRLRDSSAMLPAAAMDRIDLVTTTNQPTRLSTGGENLIKDFEGLYLYAYDDANDRRVNPGDRVIGTLTIGWGHTGPDVRPGETITKQQAEELFRRDIAGSEASVRWQVHVPLTQHQFDALVSLDFNVGSAGYKTLLRDLNAGNYKMAQQDFHLYVHGNGQVLPGLVRRRDAEAAWFGSAPPSTVNAPTLREGSRGGSVDALQRLLRIADNGRFGPATKVAVQGFQRHHHLTPNGVVGPDTWAALTHGEPALHEGSHGFAVADVQRLLGINPSGTFDPQTRAAVRNFQRASRLRATGIIDKRTWHALLTKPNSASVQPGGRYSRRFVVSHFNFADNAGRRDILDGAADQRLVNALGWLAAHGAPPITISAVKSDHHFDDVREHAGGFSADMYLRDESRLPHLLRLISQDPYIHEVGLGGDYKRYRGGVTGKRYFDDNNQTHVHISVNDIYGR